MNSKNAVKLTSILLLLTLFNGVNGATPSVSWGVEVGDVAVYWINNVQFSETGEANLATLLGDNNRTNIVVIKSKDVSSVNYTMGLMNGTNVLDNQQVRIEETDLQGQKILLPVGDLPIVLPLSAGNQNNYLQYLATTASAANFLLSSLLQDQNITNVVSPSLSGLYRGGLLNFTFSAKINDLAEISSQLLPQLNITDQLGFGTNQTINNVEMNALVSYNTTDGMLMKVGLDSTINATRQTESGTENQILTFNASLVRQSFVSIQDVLTDPARISSAAKSSFLIIGVLPALLVVRRRRN